MATATGLAAQTKIISTPVAAVAAGSDATVPVAVAPFTGTVSAVSYIANATLTGANTDTRTCSVLNTGSAGSGTTSVASKAFVSGTNAAVCDETALTLSGTAANLDVTEGDVLAFKSLHSGSTGLADPGGLVSITFTRA